MKLDSFDQIYQSYFELVYRYALSLSGNTQTAEEITQETFFKAMRSLDQHLNGILSTYSEEDRIKYDPECVYSIYINALTGELVPAD